MDNLKLVLIKNPFNKQDRETRYIANYCPSVASLISEHVPMGIHVCVTINGQVIETKDYDTTYPSCGDEVILAPYIHGGKTGKTILRVVLIIIVAIIAWYVGVVVGAAYGAGYGALASGLITALGGILINMLVPPLIPNGPEGAEQSIAYSWNPRLTQQQGISHPKWYGYNKIRTGNIISSYIDIIDGQQTTNALICYGLGPWNSVSEFQVNEQPIVNFDNVRIISRLGYVDQTVISNFNDTIVEIFPNRTVTNTSPEIYTTLAASNFDRLVVDMTFLNGLYKYNSNGVKKAIDVEVKIEISIKDANDWTPIIKDVRSTFVASTGYWIISNYNDFNIGIPVPDGVGSTDPSAHYDGEEVIYWTDDSSQVIGTWHWLDTGDIYADVTYDTKIISTNYTTKPVHELFNIPSYMVDDTNQYDIRVTRITADQAQTTLSDIMTIGVIKYVQEADFEYPRNVLVSVNALATDQLSGALAVSFLAECSIVNTFDGADWTLQFSNNPAWVCYDILTQPVIDGDNKLPSHTEGVRVDEAPWTYVGGLFSIDGSQIATKKVSFTDALVGLTGDITVTVANGSGLTLRFGAGTTGLPITIDETITHTLDAGRTDNDITIEAPASLVVDNFNLIVIGTVPDNPYAIIRYDGIDPSRLDYAKFYEWAEFCDELINDGNGGTEKRSTFNGVFDSESTMWESALTVCTTGRAMLVWRGTTISVFIDKPADPTQLFSIGNIEVDSFTETFLPQAERTSEIEASFINAESDWKREEFTILNPNIENVTNKIKLSFKGITSPTEAHRLGMLRLKQNELIPRIISWKAAIDAIACEVGDVVYLQHNVPIWGVGGRIVTSVPVDTLIDELSNTLIFENGDSLGVEGDTNSVVLDQIIDYDENETYSILIRANDDSIIERTITGFLTTAPPDILVDEFNDTLVDEGGDTLGSGEITTVVTFATSVSVDLTLCPYSIGIIDQSTKKVRLVNIKKDQDEFVTLTAVDYNPTIYNIDTDGLTMPTYNNSGLIVDLSVKNLIAEEHFEVIRGIVETIVEVHFDASSEIVNKHHLYYQKNDGAIIYYGEVTSEGTVIRNVDEGFSYTFYVSAEDKFGRKQSLTESARTTTTIYGKTTPPEALDNINLDIVNGTANFTWTQSPDLDVRVGGQINIRHTVKTSGVTWDDGVDIVTISGSSSSIQGIILLAGSYIFQVIDSTGNISSITTYNTGTIPIIIQFNAVTTLQEDTTFTGTKTNMSVVSNTLRLTETAGVPASSGTYEFASGYDLGAVNTSRITLTIEALVYDISNDIDDILTLIDTWDAFDGASVSGITYELQVRTTDDDPAGSPTWSSWSKFIIGDYTTRAFEFRLVVTNTNENANIAFAQLRVTIDMPDRIEAAETVTCTTAGLTITYSKVFQSTPAIGIATQNLATGDYYTITSKSTSAFTIQFFDSTATAVQRIFDWLAKGY